MLLDILRTDCKCKRIDCGYMDGHKYGNVEEAGKQDSKGMDITCKERIKEDACHMVMEYT